MVLGTDLRLRSHVLFFSFFSPIKWWVFAGQYCSFASGKGARGNSGHFGNKEGEGDWRKQARAYMLLGRQMIELWCLREKKRKKRLGCGYMCREEAWSCGWDGKRRERKVKEVHLSWLARGFGFFLKGRELRSWFVYIQDAGDRLWEGIPYIYVSMTLEISNVKCSVGSSSNLRLFARTY